MAWSDAKRVLASSGTSGLWCHVLMIRSLRLEFSYTVYNFTVIAVAYSRRAASESASFTGYGLRRASTACSVRRSGGERFAGVMSWSDTKRVLASSGTSGHWCHVLMIRSLRLKFLHTVHNFTVIAAAYSRRAESESASFAGYRLRRASTACSGRRCAGSVSLRRWLGAMLTRTSKQWHIRTLVPNRNPLLSLDTACAPQSR